MKNKIFPFFILSCFIYSPLLAQVINTVAGNGSRVSAGDGGLATSAGTSVSSVALDAAGNLYISDGINNKIRKVTAATGIITTIAGTGIAGFSGDGGAAINAQLNSPGDICVDPAGNVYFNDNQNFRVRKINVSTGIITTVAGDGGGGFFGGTALAVTAGIHYPNGLAVDAKYLYISLFSQQIVCKLDFATGMLITIAGNGTRGFSGDGGPALSASLGYPAGLSITASGELYIADYFNNRIRKIDAAGIITTVAGDGTAAFSGDGGAATNASLNLPTGIFVDAAGNIFIADNSNYRIRKVTAATGVIKTVAGSGNYGFGGDGLSATDPCVKFLDPHKVRVDASGNMFIADVSNFRIRKVDTMPVVSLTPTITISTSSNQICAGSSITFTASTTNAGASPTYQWKVNGVTVGSNSASFTSSTIADADKITCELTANTACTPVTITSNIITASVTPAVIPSITIASNSNSICQGSTANYTATQTNGGTAPFYQWKVNGINEGNNSASFSSSSLTNNSVISCTLTSNAACAVPANSNAITITVNPIVTPAINITASATTICNGGPVTFTATPINSGTNPVYQWKINNINVGSGTTIFTTTGLQDKDVVSCALTADANTTCVTTSNAVSNQIQITVLATLVPSVSIAASDNNICAGTPVSFTVTTQNAGSSPGYQWLLNNNNTNISTAVYTNPDFADGDVVQCIVTADNIGCPALPVTSSPVTMVVYPKPAITISASNTIVSPGSQVSLQASVDMPTLSFEWKPTNLLLAPFSLNTYTKPLDSTVTFFSIATSNHGCADTAMITISINSILLMPSAFTPNGDNRNDVFRIPQGTMLALSEFAVYNRWGNKIFYTKDIAKGWDGKCAGVPCIPDAYIFSIVGILKGKKFLLKGNVVLIR